MSNLDFISDEDDILAFALSFVLFLNWFKTSMVKQFHSLGPTQSSQETTPPSPNTEFLDNASKDKGFLSLLLLKL